MGLMVLATPFVQAPVIAQADRPPEKKAFNLNLPDITLKETPYQKHLVSKNGQSATIMRSILMQEKIMQSSAEADLKLQEGYKQWLAQFDVVADRSMIDKIKFVNSHVNKTTTYKDDYSAFGKADYSPPVAETVCAPVIYADCVDYAIQKYYALLHLGIEKERMTILVADGKSANGSRLTHAVLAVDTSFAYAKRNSLILNNMSPKVTSLKHISTVIPRTTDIRVLYTVQPDQGMQKTQIVKRKPQVLVQEIKKPR